MFQELIDSVNQDILTKRWDETNKQLARIADALERISPSVTGTAEGDNSEVFIDAYEPDPGVDESAGLDEAAESLK
jgi:hypothetical protein